MALSAIRARAKALRGRAALERDLRAFRRRYLEVFGVRQFTTLEQFLGEDGKERARREAERLLETARTSSDVKALAFRGAGVGRQAFSTLSRHLHDGAVDVADPESRRMLGTFLEMAVRTSLAADALLGDVEPELVLFNERNYAAEGPLSAA